ncbi:MAG: DUF3267 domain-containing protein, partial [Clostridia bacterium]|nr:DUF3267 domain-containing protein [Clostridia bacterium]
AKWTPRCPPGHLIVPLTEAWELLRLRHCAVLVVGVLLYLVLHELIHGVFMRHYSGQRPFYGFTGMYAYAGSNCYFGHTAYTVIALAPIVLLGIALLLLNLFGGREWFWCIYFIQITNLSGAAGDLYVTRMFSRLPPDILILDVGVRMTVYSKS